MDIWVWYQPAGTPTRWTCKSPPETGHPPPEDFINAVINSHVMTLCPLLMRRPSFDEKQTQFFHLYL